MKLLIFILALTLSHFVSAQLGGYTVVSPADVNNDQTIQDLMTFGAQYVIQQGIQAGRLSEATYEITKIFNVYEQVVSGMNYQFDVELTNSQGNTIRASYVVYSQSWTNTKEVTSYVYDVNDANLDEVEMENFEFLPEQVLLSNEGNFENFENENWNEADDVIGNEGEIEFDFSFEEEEVLPGGYSELDESTVAASSEIRDLITFGAQYVVEKGIQGHKLPNSIFNVAKVFSVAMQVVSGANYRFDVELRNCVGVTLRTQFVVYTQSWTNTKEVTSSSFDITDAPNGLFAGDCQIQMD